jgi:hypothetical protein
LRRQRKLNLLHAARGDDDLLSGFLVAFQTDSDRMSTDIQGEGRWCHPISHSGLPIDRNLGTRWIARDHDLPQGAELLMELVPGGAVLWREIFGEKLIDVLAGFGELRELLCAAGQIEQVRGGRGELLSGQELCGCGLELSRAIELETSLVVS